MPLDSELAMSIKRKEELEREEKAHLKQLTLHMTERIEEQESSLENRTHQAGSNFNRDKSFKKQQFSHPKGAPDADLIFGTSPSPAASLPSAAPAPSSSGGSFRHGSVFMTSLFDLFSSVYTIK